MKQTAVELLMAEEWTTIEYSDGQHYYNHNFES
jgi:hypothetical protein